MVLGERRGVPVQHTSIVDSNTVITIEDVVVVESVIIPSHIIAVSVERKDSWRVQIV